MTLPAKVIKDDEKKSRSTSAPSTNTPMSDKPNKSVFTRVAVIGYLVFKVMQKIWAYQLHHVFFIWCMCIASMFCHHRYWRTNLSHCASVPEVGNAQLIIQKPDVLSYWRQLLVTVVLSLGNSLSQWYCHLCNSSTCANVTNRVLPCSRKKHDYRDQWSRYFNAHSITQQKTSYQLIRFFINYFN